MLRLLKSYWFLLGIVIVLTVAHFTPFAPAKALKFGSNSAIIILFIMSGMSVSIEHLQADARKWKYHALIACFVFGFVPLMLYTTSHLFNFGDLTIGIYLVGSLPTTISSAIAFTNAAGGNSATAVISAVGGNLAGIVISPILLTLMIGSGQVHGFAAAKDAIQTMFVLALIPFAAGQVVGHYWDILRVRYRKIGSITSQVLVLLMMYCAFAKNLPKVEEQLSKMALCFVYLGVLVFFVAGCAVLMVTLLNPPRDKGAAVLFCSTQKTLAFGVPFAIAYFGTNNPLVGVYTVPLIFYYLGQMASSSVLLHWWLKGNHELEAKGRA